MCGIAGFLTTAGWPTESEELLGRIAGTIVHRGPDEGGSWQNPDAGVALVHRRLSILDLSDAGRQPMNSSSGRYTIVFNGEIYNHNQIREELSIGPKPAWRGHSDTETLLAGFDQWGVVETIKRAVGMFAFGVWDHKERVLTLGRDRLGEKPLYYGWQGETFLFGSELKALRAHPAFRGVVDRQALALYMRLSCIPAPFSIYEGIFKLKPGMLLTVSRLKPIPHQTEYWSARNAIDRARRNPFSGNERDAVEALDWTLSSAISLQMIADVPLGAFLSGGIDSSAVVALMQAHSSRPVKTFCIGFDEELYNEAEHAKAVAQHLGTDHTDWHISSRDAREVVPKLSQVYDEPFADSSQIPTFLVAQMARRHVTVSLSGDAGDELFAGYNRYLVTTQLWHRIARLPLPMRRFVTSSLLSVSPANWNNFYSMIKAVLPGSMKHVNIGEKLHKGAGVLGSRNPTELYRGLVSHWGENDKVVLDATDPFISQNSLDSVLSDGSAAEQMMASDLVGYLPNDILCKVDRAAMFHSLETRVPFLDHRVVEFAWQLPLALKLRNGITKWVLREVLYKYVPREIIDRPKMGFGVPIDSWLRGPLKEWAEELLREDRICQEGFFDPKPIRKKWDQHQARTHNWQHHLWDVLMFQEWLAQSKRSST